MTRTATRTRHRRQADEQADAWYHRLTKPVVTGIALALAMTAASVVGLGATFAADAPPVTQQGLPVPDALRQPIAAAALSCPALTPARLAGQLMATSHFDTDATFASQGKGVAGLTDAEWKKWAPAPKAARTDAASTVLALAHEMCDLVGAVRAAKVPGDQWHNALAAFVSGTPAVVKAKGVPSDAAAFVDQVDAYAAWYAQQDAAPSPAPSPSPSTTVAPAVATGAAKPVPAADLPLVLAAGKVCPTVTPARVAGQLMAASGFQANLLGPTGAQGIAQFLPDIWTQYGTGSPWDTAAAVPALGTAMCDLVGQLASLGGDPYQLALAAFGWGTDAVRQAGAVPQSAGVQSFVKAVAAYADAYATDPALSSGQLVTAPEPSGSATNPAPASPTPGKPRATPTPSPTHWLPLTVEATTVLERGQAIQSTRTRLVMQSNGDLAIYDEHNQLRWTTGTSGRGGYRAVFQADGNLVVYDQNGASLWTSNTPGHDGAVLVLEADGNVCIVYQGQVIWAANTAH